ncbi:hypothetical protein GCM10011506_39870 [Marivirga lumbricoides]|uniref:Uncharacterized protein n=1 Tax=Marivirga lumbricoides TaxID=1046115 RepID=A0ABQ1N3E2_9BACT|nr:hypothetical protein GCM10011506_39870 [Marivirga lumbricoides]
MKKIYCIIITLVIIAAVKLSAKDGAFPLQCGNEITRLSSMDNSFVFKIATSENFEATLFKVLNGVYVEVQRKSGKGNTNLTFNSIEKDDIYKLVVEFSASEKLCKTRQISGLKL